MRKDLTETTGITRATCDNEDYTYLEISTNDSFHSFRNNYFGRVNISSTSIHVT